MLRSALCRIPRTSLPYRTSTKQPDTAAFTQRYTIFKRQQQQQLLQQERYLSTSQVLQYERSPKKNGDKNEQDPSSRKKKTFSNRRFVNLEGAEDRSNRHLYTLPRDVYGTSDRVEQLLRLAGLEQAIEFLVHLPLDLQSTVAWNHLLGYCAKHGKSQMAETLFTQMGKRRMQPSDITFGHLLTAFINTNSPTSVERADSWIERMERYGVQPTIYHYNTLLNVYKKKGHNNQVLAKVRQMMRDDDLLPYPDQVTLSIALQVCPLLTNSQDKEIKRIWDYIRDCLGGDEDEDQHKQQQQQQQQPKSISSLRAKVLQLQSNDQTYRNDQQSIEQKRRLLNKLKYEREPLKVDDTLVVALIRALGRANIKYKEDQEVRFDLAMDIVGQLYGLRLNEAGGKDFGLTPGVTVLDAIVRYCGAVRRFDAGEAYFDLALQKFPTLEPDSQAYSAYAWMQSNTRRKKWQGGGK